MNKIGAHLPGGKDLTKAIPLAKELNCEAIQVFFNSPTSYRVTPADPGTDEQFREEADDLALEVFVHGPYLMNFGSAKDAGRASAARLLMSNLDRARTIGAKGVVLHCGSSGEDGLEAGLKRVRSTLLPLLESLDADHPPVLLEPMAGQGSTMTSTVASIAGYLDAVDNHPKLQVCLDTAHLWAAGEDLSTFDSATSVLDEFGSTVGFDRLALIHANDSKAKINSHLDRHESLDSGQIGQEVWKAIFAHEDVIVPLVLETPSETRDVDLAILRSLR